MSSVAFIDIEQNPKTQKITDIGAVLSDDSGFHKNDPRALAAFVAKASFICGHNILSHDLPAIQKYLGDPDWGKDCVIDTLLLSPLLFPKNPYHKLLKDDKLQNEERNNPVNDAIKAKNLFYDEVAAFENLDGEFKEILYALLQQQKGFLHFFRYMQYAPKASVENISLQIRNRFKNEICADSNVDYFIHYDPVSLAYSLALLNCHDRYSITPPWVLRNHPGVERILFLFKNTPCITGCDYCNIALNPKRALKQYFGFEDFRKYEDEPLQEKAVQAAVDGKSLLAVFPTGGGKSITFQVPALLSGDNTKALTVVISPLQSLMKDQVDNLEKKSITAAVAINGLLDPIARGEAIERVASGQASILYISPESLRSVTIERLLLKRKIARFVIDEAHCFSSWGQDFRVDYLYIGDFIKNLQEKKNSEYPIPVSCFTATAKQKVVEDIRNYFKDKLNLHLEVFSASASRKNLHYQVYQRENEEEKYNQLRSLIESNNRPTIVYVSRTRRANQLAERLSKDGFAARAYHGKMDKEEKSANQDEFMQGNVNIIVATSAFGMGVDKSDVGAVIHYDISDSLENYVQEAGRAGRDENIQADCYVLFNEEDLDKHFILLNQTKISVKEINQVWKAIKDLTKTRDKASNSALEIARRAGWDDGVNEIETRVTTAIAALEDAGYLKRGQNNPQLFATSILSKNAQEAIDKIQACEKFDEKQKVHATRIIKKLFSSKSKRLSTEEIAESRIDYISDQLGIAKRDVLSIVELLREEKILADTKDLTAFIKRSEVSNRALSIVENFSKQESLLLSLINETEIEYNLKEIIELFIEQGVKDGSINKLKTILNFWAIKNWIKRRSPEYSRNHMYISLQLDKNVLKEKLEKRQLLADLIIKDLYRRAMEISAATTSVEEVLVEFSIQELKDMIEKQAGLFKVTASIDEIEDCLFYLSRIEAIKIEGGFLVLYNRLTIDRIEKNNRIQYKESDYEKLGQFYQQKVQQIHIVGEYAKKMIRNYQDALQFADDYFRLNYNQFLSKYFPGSRQEDIRRPLTPEKFKKLFGELSPAQLEILKDSNNQYIVVAAGPGSGKTRLLVHKLASLLLAEDVKHEQLLMLTFSRAAATEFKKRLLELIGNAANFIEIKTFHSYCFDLLGRIGSLSEVENVLGSAVEKIKSGEIEASRITKTVLVVDEAQDMNMEEYSLVQALMDQNEDMRVILVGDDDQNIYGFRQADSKYMQQLITQKAAIKYELTQNYRSAANIVAFANSWASTLKNRLKTDPGFAMQQQDGLIHISSYSNQCLVVPLVLQISQSALSGSTCVLTKTNDEAAQVAGLLLQKNIPAKLIQSNDGFFLGNLYELRYFSNQVHDEEQSAVISEEDWTHAKQLLNTEITLSDKKEMVNAVIKAFEQTNPVRKYKSDWKTFLQESKLEDFIKIDTETIFVSTIHKAKGKEFNNVFISLSNFDGTEAAKREFYVAATRAQTSLSIHYNGNFLRSIAQQNGIDYREDKNVYGAPEQIAIHLTHRDVNLGYFDFVQHRVNKLFSGAALKLLDNGLANAAGEPVLKYSNKFNELLQGRLKKGYKITAAAVNFIVYWKNEKSGKEVRVLLPRIVMRRN